MVVGVVVCVCAEEVSDRNCGGGLVMVEGGAAATTSSPWDLDPPYLRLSQMYHSSRWINRTA